jgi:hypothetical protein
MRLTQEWLNRQRNADLRFAQVDALRPLVGWLVRKGRFAGAIEIASARQSAALMFRGERSSAVCGCTHT